jgi:hypothetical protein
VGAFIQANRYSPHLINISRMIHSTDRALHCTRTASYAPRKSAGAPDPSASPPPNWLRSPKKHHIHPCTRYPPPPPRLPTQISPRLPPEI